MTHCLMQACALAIEDITLEDADHLSELILRQIEALESATSQQVASLCTGGGMRAAREKAILQRPDMVSLDCASQQVCIVYPLWSRCQGLGKLCENCVLYLLFRNLSMVIMTCVKLAIIG